MSDPTSRMPSDDDVHPSALLDKMSPSVKELISVVKSEQKEKTMVASRRQARPPVQAAEHGVSR